MEMRTLGIDLAAEPPGTAACLLRWTGAGAVVEERRERCDDDALLELMERAQKVGVDCPLGWPDPFVAAVGAHRDGAPWPGRDAGDPAAFRRSLRLRLTDEHVAEAVGVTPLSVSTDRIGVTAMRCALLLDGLVAQGEPLGRGGDGVVCEVYPAAALRRWEITSRGYKGPPPGASAVRILMLEELRDLGPVLVADDAAVEAWQSSDHSLDALLCALVARAVALGLTDPAPTDREGAARVAREGWIHVPAADSLAELGPGA